MRLKRLCVFLLSAAVCLGGLPVYGAVIGNEEAVYLSEERESPSEGRAVLPAKSRDSSEDMASWDTLADTSSRDTAAATPSQGTAAVTPSQGVPVEAVSFLAAVPDEVPSWYVKIKGSAAGGQAHYQFTDRYGTLQHRIYGCYEDEAEECWYECEADGTVTNESMFVDLEWEDRNLAPYRYESTDPTEEDFRELSARLYGLPDEIFQYDCEVSDPEMGRNYDNSFFDIWWISEDLGDYDMLVDYWMYGHVKNTENQEKDSWFPCDDTGRVVEPGPQIAMFSLASARTGGVNLHGGIYARGATSGTTSNFTALTTQERGYIKGTLDTFEEQEDIVFSGTTRSTLSTGVKAITSLHNDIYNSSIFADKKARGIYFIEPNGSYYQDSNTWGQWTPDGKAYSGSITVPEGALLVFNFPPMVGSGCWLYDNSGNEVISQTAYSSGYYKSPDTAQYMVVASSDLSGRWLWMKDASYSYNNDASGDAHAVTGRCYVYMDITIICEHTYGSWITTVQPTCTTGGTQQRSCTKCGDIQTQALSPLNHSWESSYYTEANNGTYYRRCIRGCGATTDVRNNPYTVAYGPGAEGTGTESRQSFTYSVAGTVKGSSEFTRKYYSYVRWKYTDDAGNTAYIACNGTTPGLTKVYNKTVALEPDWYQTSAQVTFYDWDDTELLTREVNIGSSVTAPTVPGRDGYRFVKWDKDTGNVQGHMEVRAQYEPRWYTYHFDSQGGTEVEEKQYQYGQLLGQLPKTTRAGYTFAGWYDGKTEGDLITPQTSVKLGGDRLYARWIANSYDIVFHTDISSCGVAKKRVTYDEKIGILPVASLEDFEFLGWFLQSYSEEQPEMIMNGDPVPEKEKQVTSDQIYREDGDTDSYAYLKLRYEELTNHRNRRPGPDGYFGTEDDGYFLNGRDGLAGTRDDVRIYAGADGIYGTADDYYLDSKDRKIHAGQDTVFGTEDDFRDNGDGTNTRPGRDCLFDTKDDITVSNGLDGIPGTGDDWVDNSDKYPGTNLRPGRDGIFGTEDDEVWWNGEDGVPGTADDKLIHPGLDGILGTEDDWVDNSDKYPGTNLRPGPDGIFGTEDDEAWWNGEDEVPGTADDKLIHPGLDGILGTEDDWVDNSDKKPGTNLRPGPDGIFGTEDDEVWLNGEDGIPGTEDDVKYVPEKPSGGNGSGGNGSGGNGSGSGSGSGGHGGSSGSGSGGSGSSGSVTGDSSHGPGVENTGLSGLKPSEIISELLPPSVIQAVNAQPGNGRGDRSQHSSGSVYNRLKTQLSSGQKGPGAKTEDSFEAQSQEETEPQIPSTLKDPEDRTQKPDGKTPAQAKKNGADSEQTKGKKGILRSILEISFHPVFLLLFLLLLFILILLLIVLKKRREEEEAKQNLTAKRSRKKKE